MSGRGSGRDHGHGIGRCLRGLRWFRCCSIALLDQFGGFVHTRQRAQLGDVHTAADRIRDGLRMRVPHELDRPLVGILLVASGAFTVPSAELY